MFCRLVGCARGLVDVDELVPDVLGVASLVHVGSRTRLGWPLAIDADIGDLVLLASSCRVRRDTVAVQGPWLDELEWASLIDAEPEEALGLADVRRSPHAGALAPAEALLRVAVPDAD